MQYQKPIIIQEQRLKLSPQMYQSIQLMALPLQDLKFRIEEEVEKNPALEIVLDRSTVSLDSTTPQEPKDYEPFENSSDPGYASRPLDQEGSDAKQKFIEGALSRPESLQDHLLWQLRLHPLPEELFSLGEMLIQNLDRNGFHRESPDSFLTPRQLELLPAVLDIIQGLDPVGCGVSDYSESLLVQWTRDPGAPEGVDRLIREFLPEVERGKMSEIARAMKQEIPRVEEMVRYLKTLNPFPGSAYTGTDAQYVIPDLMVRLEEGEYKLYLNDEEIPVLGVADFFKDLTSPEGRGGGEGEKEARRFAQEHVRDARWFINSIQQRHRTLLKIARAILDFQREFFVRGPKYLVPLTLKDIAEEVSVHETTVSRISNAKYIQTEWGLYPLKYFFTNSISGSGSGGSRFSKEGVKERVREILEANSSGKKLSDQKISDMLKKEGINIARRTVAKYRGELDIESSFGR